MMIILRAKDEEDKIILTLQPRIPVPHLSFPELPAGMLDGSGNFAGAAAKEIEEETGNELLKYSLKEGVTYVINIGLVIKERELVDMTQLAYGDKWRGIYPSAGGSGIYIV